MIKLLLLVLLFLPVGLYAQRDFLVVIEGRTTNLLDHKDVYGVSIDLMQQDAVLTKVLSNQSGEFFVSAKISQGLPVQLRLTKGGYLTKYILFDLTTLQGQANSPSGLHLARSLSCELYELKPDVDLNFAKNQITDKYVWSSGAIVQVPLVKTDADAKASEAYQYAIDQKSIARLMQLANQQIAANQPDKAVPYFDTILMIRPDYALASQKKQQISDQKAAALKRSQDEAQVAQLLDEALAAKNTGDLNLAESKLKAADAIIPNQPKVNAERQQIAQLRNEAADAQAKTQAFQKAMQAATALITAKKYDEAEAKYKEAQLIKPTEKEADNTQLAQLKELRFDIQNEAVLKKTMKLANDQYLQKKYDLALETYKKADKQIALFHKQALIDSYSKELQAGMKRVTEGINSMSQVYQNQLAKANENFNKGPQFYGTAKSILNSDPMKSRQNEPGVIELKEKIAAMEAYYAARKSAYQLVKVKDNTAALKALEKLQLSAQAQQQYLSQGEVSRIQKSADSLRTILAPIKPALPKEDVAVEPAGIRLAAPGEAVSGENSMAFNDLQISRDAKQETPYRTQQQIRTEVEYQNYFSQQNAQVGSFETTAQLEMTRAQRELNTKQNTATQNTLQANQAQDMQSHEVAVTSRDAATAVRQQENSTNLTVWKDAKDDQSQNQKAAADVRQQSELDRLNVIQNQKDLQLKQQAANDEKVKSELDQRNQNVAYTKQVQQETAANGGQTQYEQIQKTAASTVQLKTTPNYLRDENGVLFASNTLTEKTYQLKNKEGYVTKVIVRRVVVDSNGHGVVFEQTTDENGKTYFTRDGQVSTEYIWFNESTGANVLIK
ncbi:MAG: hypothetical protein K9J18_06200 [Crocinitomicaceae bacterium]|nr:hypothetical protein [Crocinitomicaceae bacterium]